MLNILMNLRGIFVVILVAGLIGFTILMIKGNALEKESIAFVDEITPKILSRLNKDTLFQYASYELKSSASSEEFDKMFDRLGKLGQFKEYKGSDGPLNISVSTEEGKQITGLHEAQAEFENGPATIKITTIKEGDNWKVISFHIDSMALEN